MPAGRDRMANDTAVWTTTKIGAVRKPAAVTTGYVRRKLPKIYSRELVDVIFDQPYCRMAKPGQGEDCPVSGISLSQALVSIEVLRVPHEPCLGGLRGRNRPYGRPPAQTPACSFSAPGSSVVLASALQGFAFMLSLSDG
jgi:hypothetical protein